MTTSLNHLDFDGIDDRIVIPASSSINNLSLHDFTIGISADFQAPLTSYGEILCKTDGGGEVLGLDLYCSLHAPGVLYIQFNISRDGNTEYCWIMFEMAIGKHYLEIDYTQSTGEARAFIDGTEPTYSATYFGGSVPDDDSSYDMGIFRIPDLGSSPGKGSVRWVMIHNTVLHTENFTSPSLYECPQADSNTVLRLALDEGSGSVVYDTSDYGNNGTITGATWDEDRILHVVDADTGDLVEVDTENPTGTLSIVDADTGEIISIDLAAPTGTVHVVDADTGNIVEVDYANPSGVITTVDDDTGEFVDIDLSNPTNLFYVTDANTGKLIQIDLSTDSFFSARGIVVPKLGGDTTPPTVTITSTETSPSAVLPVPIAFTLSEVATDFAVGDLTLNGCTVANFAGSGMSYTCEATPSTPNGTFTIDIAEGAFHDAAGNGNVAATQFSFTSSAFTIADEFTDTRAAGAVNGTNATPTGGARTVIDTGNTLSIGSGVLSFAGSAAGDPSLRYPSLVRVAGKAIIGEITQTGIQVAHLGFDINTNGEITNALILNGYIIREGGTYVKVEDFAGATSYKIAVVLRATGVFYFVKGGAFTNWTLIFNFKTGTTSPLYPGIGLQAAVATNASSQFIRVPANVVTVAPLASDAFTRANGTLGNTGGSGSEESGGSGLAWAAQLGTWGVATNKAACSALDGGTSLGIATVNASTANVMVEVIATRAAGTSGLVLRYTNPTNYIKAVHNGTNLQVIEVVNGTPNTLINSSATYGATTRLMLSLNGTKLRAYYNDVLIGSEATTAITTGNNHGLFTDDTGATFDNFVVWAKGNGGEYASLFDKYTNP